MKLFAFDAGCQTRFCLLNFLNIYYDERFIRILTFKTCCASIAMKERIHTCQWCPTSHGMKKSILLDFNLSLCSCHRVVTDGKPFIYKIICVQYRGVKHDLINLTVLFFMWAFWRLHMIILKSDIPSWVVHFEIIG